MKGKGGGKGSRRDIPDGGGDGGRDDGRGDPGWEPDPPPDFSGILHPFDPSGFEAVEAQAERSLRPATLPEFIGQRRVVENLSIAIEAAKARGDVLDHVLLSG